MANYRSNRRSTYCGAIGSRNARFWTRKVRLHVETKNRKIENKEKNLDFSGNVTEVEHVRTIERMRERKTVKTKE